MIDTALVLQIVACSVTLAAAWLTGNKRTSGPALNIVAALCFAAVNAWAELWLCAAFSATMGVVNARNFIRWKREVFVATYRGPDLEKRRRDTKNDPVTGICKMCGGECGQC